MPQPTDVPEPGLDVASLLLGCGCLAILAGLAWATMALPEATAPLARLAAERLPETDLGNPVNAVLLNFRGFDTLLETMVLVLALAGVRGLAPGSRWRGAGANFRSEVPAEPQLIVLLKILVPLALLTAVYLLWVGADEPGGAFQSGTILAAIGILLVSSRIQAPPRHDGMWLHAAIAVGPLLFAGIGIALAGFGGTFLTFPLAVAKPLIVLIETGIAVSVAATLILLASGLPAFPAGDAARSR